MVVVTKQEPLQQQKQQHLLKTSPITCNRAGAEEADQEGREAGGLHTSGLGYNIVSTQTLAQQLSSCVGSMLIQEKATSLTSLKQPDWLLPKGPTEWSESIQSKILSITKDPAVTQ